MDRIPPCRRLGTQCRAIPVTLRIGSFEEGLESLDHEATWLLGHTQQISFGVLWEDEGDLYVEAILHVGCRYLRPEGLGARGRPLPGRGPVPADRPGAAQGPRTGPEPAGRGRGKPLRQRTLPDGRAHARSRVLSRPPG